MSESKKQSQVFLWKTFKSVLEQQDLSSSVNEDRCAIPSEITEEEDYAALKEQKKRKRHKIKNARNGSFIIEEDDLVRRAIL